MPRCQLHPAAEAHIDMMVSLLDSDQRSDYFKCAFDSISKAGSRLTHAAASDSKSPYYSRLFRLPSNIEKNRYSGVFPFDFNAFAIDNSPDGAYINASKIYLPLRGPNSRELAYIATQGPMKTTTHNFWRMVRQSDSRLIVCLAKPVENGKPKFDIYWTESGKFFVQSDNHDNDYDYDSDHKHKSNCDHDDQGFTVTHVATEVWDDSCEALLAAACAASSPSQMASMAPQANKSRMMHKYLMALASGTRFKEHPDSRRVFGSLRSLSVRTFSLSSNSSSSNNGNSSGSSRMSVPNAAANGNAHSSLVYLVATDEWPDYEIMPAEDLLALIEFSRFINISIHHPVIVHCSAGVGRTGTFIAIDFISRYLEDSINHPEFETSRDIVHTTVSDLRQQRALMVITLEQYTHIYNCIIQHLSGLGLIRH